MSTEIETPRLILRRYLPSDAQQIFRLVDENRADLAEGFPTTTKEVSAQELAEKYIQDKLQQWELKTYFCYGVVLKSTGQHIGQIQIKNIRWEIPSAELGYFFDRNHRRQGFAKETAEALIHGVLNPQNFRRIYLRIFPTNEPSLRLAKSLGFEMEGLHRSEFASANGDIKDVIYFAKIRSPSHGISA